MGLRETFNGFFPTAIFLQVGAPQLENSGIAEKVYLLIIAAAISFVSQLSIKFIEKKLKK